MVLQPLRLAPLAPLAPLGGLTRAASRSRRSRSSDRFELLPDEEESLVRSIARGTMGSLAAVANVLDTPGSMVRNTLAGRNPFRGFFAPEERTTGRQLLRQYNVVAPNRVGKLDAGDWAGFGAEVLLDPFSWIGAPMSAISKGGKVARSAGLLDDLGQVARASAVRGIKPTGKRVSRMRHTLADLVDVGDEATRATRRQKATDIATEMGTTYEAVADKPLGGLLSIGPLGRPWATAGTGEMAQKVAGGMDVLGEGLRFGNVPGTKYSPGRHLAQMFKKTVKETKSEPFQRVLGDPANIRGAAEETARIRGITLRLASTLKDKAGKVDPNDLQAMRRFVEGIDDPANEAMTEIYDVLHTELGKQGAEFRELGMAFHEWMDPTGGVAYFPRKATELGSKGRAGRPLDAFYTKTASNIKREEHLVGIPQGTSALIELAKDKNINAVANMVRLGSMSRKELAGDIAKWSQARGGILPEKFTRTLKKAKKGQPAVTEQGDRYKALAKTLVGLPEESRLTGIFGAHPLQDFLSSMLHANEAKTNTRRVYDVLADVLKETPDLGREGTVVLSKILKKGKKTGKGLGLDLGDETQGAIKQIADRMGVPYDKNIANRRIPADVAADAVRLVESYKTPEAAGQVLQAVDSITNIWKAGVTAPRIAFHSRNLVSALYRNWISGTFSVDSVTDANRILRGGPVRNAHEIPIVKQILNSRKLALNEGNGTRVVGELIGAHEVGGKFAGEVAQRAGSDMPVGRGLDDLLSEAIAGEGFRFGTIARQWAGRTPETGWNPLEIRGFNQRKVTQFGPVKAGETAGAYVEGVVRIAPFLQQLRKGIDPVEAAKKVFASQVDYRASAFTSTETAVLKRLFPFYSFTSRQFPWVIRHLWEQPGGKLAQTLRAINKGRRPGETVPEHIATGTSIPLPPGAGGDDRYLAGMGLMFETPMGFISHPAYSALGQMNPMVKAPLEYVTGQSFFQKGRDLQDVDPTVGRIFANIAGMREAPEVAKMRKPARLPGPAWMSRAGEQLASNLPISPQLTRIRQFTDPRKRITPDIPLPDLPTLMSMFTGMRISDVSEAAKEGVLRERTKDIMRDIPGHRVYEKVYFSKEELARMTPEERRRALSYQAVMSMLGEKAKVRAAARKTGR